MNYPSVVKFSLSLAVLAFAVTTSAHAATPLIASEIGTKSARSPFEIKSQAIPVAMNRGMLAQLKKNDEVEFLLPNNTRPMIVFDRIEDHGGGIRSSVGYLKDHGKDFRVIITTGPGGTFGSIFTPNTVYRIVPGKDGQDLLVDMTEEKKLIPPINLGNDTRRAPNEADSGFKQNALPSLPMKRLANEGEPGVALVTPTPQRTVDLMIVYTNGLANRLGVGLLTRLYNLVTAANTAYVDSEVAITVRLVNATMVNYTDGGDNGTALDDISPSGGVASAFSNIEAIRTSVGADMVALLRNGSDFGGSGIAWLTTSTTPSANFMYSVTTGCVVGCDSVFIHELGHNMGNAHDRATDAAQGNGTADGGVFTYSFGHFFCASGTLTCNPNLPFVSGGCGQSNLPQCTTSSTNNMGTIMSYFDPVTLKFSNPNITCRQTPGSAPQPCGVSELAANSADNALSMNNMRTALEIVKATQVAVPPGALQLSAASFFTTETAGMATITVQRVGGSVGMITVNYATQDGTALAGSDYTATSGTLTWANGDTANKTISVPITNDGLVEGQEAFSIVLSNPGGVTGAFLGFPSSATINILLPEVFPPDCANPAGWTKPATTPYGWDVASDRARSGACSLKSVPMPNAAQAGQANANKAQISVTGNFQAGTVSFYYNVSSEAGWDCLRFLIGPTQQSQTQQFQMGNCSNTGGFGASGEISAWTLVSIPVAAGPQTFTWSYEKDESQASGSDAGWIDDVTLPPLFAFDLNVARDGTGAGTVTGTGINCGADCIESVSVGNMVTLTASPAVGSAFTGWSGGGCAGTGTCVVTINAATTVTATFALQSFNLDVNRSGAGTGTVTSAPAGINCGATCSFAFNFNTMITLTATPAMGSSFTGWSGGGCSGTATCNVTIMAATVVNAAFATAPGAPTGLVATPGNGVAGIAFSPPASDGSSPILDYTVTCDGGSMPRTGSASPITVTGLNNGMPYNCTVAARNAIGTGPASATVGVTPTAGAALALVSVSSRKTHPGMVIGDVAITAGIPIAGLVSVEPRSDDAHSIVFLFNNTVTVAGSVTAVDGAMAPIGNPVSVIGTNVREVVVTLTGVADSKRVTVTLAGVNGALGTSASMGFLVGDVSSNRAINASDISAVKAHLSQAANSVNFRFDLNVDGTVNAADVTAAKARSGRVLP